MTTTTTIQNEVAIREWQHGDLVECVTAGSYFTVGKTYQVKEFSKGVVVNSFNIFQVAGDDIGGEAIMPVGKFKWHSRAE